ncbi:MAG TPA: ATP-binding protein [Pseudomonadales bacterium]|nr:ATP-binding protein [Pseudomonadales bacterium]
MPIFLHSPRHTPRRVSALLLWLCLWLAAGCAYAVAPVATVKSGEIFSLQGYADYLPDHANIDREALLAGAYDNLFQRYDDQSPTLTSGSPHWLRIQVTNNSDRNQLVLSVGNVLYTEVELLYDGNNQADEVDADVGNKNPVKPVTRLSGLLHPHELKAWPYHDIAFPIFVEPGDSKTFYFRLSTPFFAMFEPSIADEVTYSKRQAIQNSHGYLLAGIMLGVLLYVCMFAWFVRELSEVRHCIGLAFCSLLILLHGRGYIFSLLPENIWFNMHLYGLIFAAYGYTFSSFSKRHFRTRKNFPILNRVLQGFEYMYATFLLVFLFIPVAISTQIIGGIAMLVVIVFCISSVYVWANSTRNLTIYVMGTLIFLFACVLAVVESLGLINLGGKAREAFEVALCLQTILFSLALGESIRDYQNNQIQIAVSGAAATAEDKTKSSFLAKMSQELRTPMHDMLNTMQLLDRTPLNDEQQHYTQNLRNAGNMLMGVIDDVLDYSCIITGKLQLEAHNFNMIELLTDIESMFKKQARQKQLQLRFSFGNNNHAHLYGDAGRLRQVITNLVGNAIKFTDSGSVSVRVRIEESSQTRLTLHCEVEDTGIGISDDDMQQVFCQHIRTGENKSQGGSGLGLVICKKLVEIMGGNIRAESAPGYGSLFAFQIPVSPGMDSTHNLS